MAVELEGAAVADVEALANNSDLLELPKVPHLDHQRAGKASSMLQCSMLPCLHLVLEGLEKPVIIQIITIIISMSRAWLDMLRFCQFDFA